MKIRGVGPILCDGGFRPWIFVKITTDEGITGYGDCTDWDGAPSIATCHRSQALVTSIHCCTTLWNWLKAKTRRFLNNLKEKDRGNDDGKICTTESHTR